MMEITNLAALTIAYIMQGIKNSKGFQQSKKEISVAIWDWIKPIFLKDDAKLVKDFENNPDTMKPVIEYRLQRLIEENENFSHNLEELMRNLEQNKVEFVLKDLSAGKDIETNINQLNIATKIERIKADGNIRLNINQDLKNKK